MCSGDPGRHPSLRSSGPAAGIPAAGPGERLVQVLTCVERATDRAERVLPSVDHMALRREAVTPASVLAVLRRSGPADLVEPFESWQRLLQDFDSAVACLTDLGDGDGDGDYQSRLGECIAEARRCRQAVEEAADQLRRRVASGIDSALAHEETLRRPPAGPG